MARGGKRTGAGRPKSNKTKKRVCLNLNIKNLDEVCEYTSNLSMLVDYLLFVYAAHKKESVTTEYKPLNLTQEEVEEFNAPF